MMRPEEIALLGHLVAARSVNPPGDTTAPMKVAATWLRERGLAPRIVAAVPDKPNLVASIDNGDGPHLVLNAHLDTVPPGDLDAWSVPPWELTVCDGRLYGLGTGNMKAAAAAMMLAFAHLAGQRDPWQGRLTLTLVADECVFGSDGAAHLLEAEPEVRGDMLICGEGPGHMALAIAEKGLMWVRLSATGPVGQGMLTTRGSAASVRLAGAIAELDRWNDILVTPPLAALDHDRNTQGKRLSVNVGRIGSEGFISQASSAAFAEIDMRLPPGMSVADISGRLDALCDGAPLEWELIKGWDANWSAPDTVVAWAVSKAATKVRGNAPAPVTRSPASDAARWRELGIPAVCFGPQPELASGVDDYVFAQDFCDCVAIYKEAVTRLLPSHTAE